MYIYGHTLISQGNSWYYLYNAHGDVVKYINANGAVLKSYDYDAFGEEADPSTTDTNPFRYAGQYFDDETGTYYLRARYYNPGNGRFSQEDTHWNTGNMLYGDDPLKLGEYLKPSMDSIVQSSNLYVYCMGNPVRFYDPYGADFWDVLWGWCEATIDNSLAGAGLLALASGGTAGAGSVVIAGVGVVGTAEVAYGAFVFREATGNLAGDINKLKWQKMRSKKAEKLALELGYVKVKGRFSNGQPIFYNKKTGTYITPDVGSGNDAGSHNGGVWKMAKSIEGLGSKSTRMGTYDRYLNRIGD
ncbi:MAG: toxin C-terminal domain-containing protein [Clostridia bacterium]|nr:toxin C-terminal domain-containing protein [Clostridia bacterium]